MTVGWALVGPGRLADWHLAPSMKLSRTIKMVGVLSRDKDKGAAFAEKHGFQRSYCSMDELLADSDVDVVYVSTPNGLHAPQALQAASGGKHVFVQKPLATKPQDAQAVIDTCREHGVKLGVAYKGRGHPAHIKAREIVASGDIGAVFLVTGEHQKPPNRGWHKSWWYDPSLGSGMVPRTGVHWIDLMRFILGHEITEVSAFFSPPTEGNPFEDVALGMFRFDNGILGSLHCSDIVPHPLGRDRIEFSGSKGRLTEVYAASVSFQREETHSYNVELHVVTTAGSTTYQFDPTNLFLTEMEAFNSAIKDNSEPLANGLDGLRVDQVTAALYESSCTGKAVKVYA